MTSEKSFKLHQNRPINRCSNYVLLSRRALRPRSVTEKTVTNTIEPTAGASCTILAKLYMVIEHVEAIKKVSNIFRSNA